MTKATKIMTANNYVTAGSNNLTIPSREEFHKTYNEISDYDFCTSSPNIANIDRIAWALKGYTKTPTNPVHNSKRR